MSKVKIIDLEKIKEFRLNDLQQQSHEFPDLLNDNSERTIAIKRDYFKRRKNLTEFYESVIKLASMTLNVNNKYASGASTNGFRYSLEYPETMKYFDEEKRHITGIDLEDKFILEEIF